MKNHTQQFQKRRKFLLVLPLLALPFITLAFWAMGGGTAKTDGLAQKQQGLNTELPGAKLSADPLDKMSIYNQAKKDSLAFMEQLKGDPYAVRDSIQTAYAPANIYGQPGPQGGYQSGTYADPNEARVREKLAQLERSLAQPDYGSYPSSGGQSGSADIQRLEAMMQSMNNSNNSDPEMEQLSMMLDNLADIQNPARAQQKLQELSQKNKGRVYGVSRKTDDADVSILAAKSNVPGRRTLPQSNGNSFYGLEDTPSFADTLLQIAIPAVVHETQTLVSGATIKMRLSEDILVNGVQIPAGTFVSGTCSINGERLGIEVSAIRYNKNLFQVALSAYDPDAIEGIRIPGAIGRDAAKDGADRALQGMQFMSLNPSIGAQAAGAGVEVAKGLFGKKAKLVRVTVKAGHPLLLLDMKARQSFN
jgi:conjugative transposon TraM protein